MTIQALLKERGITECLHFTTQRGVVGILASKHLFSRAHLPDEDYLEHVLLLNSKSRAEASEFFDKKEHWLDYVNLSLTEINTSFFRFSQNWHKYSDVWWAILAFDSEIIAHEGVYFATTNNSYEHCKRTDGEVGLEALFAQKIARKGSWTAARGSRGQANPTCEQAEVLYPRAVSTEFLRKIYVREEEHQDKVDGWVHEFGLPNVEVVVDKAKFLGNPN
jgi:hypothetical protein